MPHTQASGSFGLRRRCARVRRAARLALPRQTPSRPARRPQSARRFRDAEAPRPWSKYSEGSSRHKKLVSAAEEAVAAAAADGGAGKGGKDGRGKPKKGAKKGAGPKEADEKLAEFLALMQPRGKARVWSNDELLPGSGVLPAGASGGGPRGRRAALWRWFSGGVRVDG